MAAGFLIIKFGVGNGTRFRLARGNTVIVVDEGGKVHNSFADAVAETVILRLGGRASPSRKFST
jgi:hypothetical protein